MAKPKLEGKILNDMMKVLFYMSEYPGKDIREVAGEFGSMSPIDFNGACWRAQDENYIFIDKTTGKIDILKVPEKWEFGEAVDHLVTLTPYILSKLAEVEANPEENFFANYVSGYAAFDVLVAIRYMTTRKIITSYEVKDVSELENGEKITDSYTFYSLPEHADKRWGENQFKDQEKLEK